MLEKPNPEFNIMHVFITKSQLFSFEHWGILLEIANKPNGVGMLKNEFDILCCLAKDAGLTQREIAACCGVSLGAANALVRKLKTEKLVDDRNNITDAGLEALAPYRVRNAVIMAAGMSTRFAPLSYERPKGVLRVRGEVLVERQIRQLKEAGIDDIIVVVGYKREEFFYLEEAFGVEIVVNNEYATRNNNSTIKKVEDRLGNTYICSSDDYFTENPFEKYVFGSFYASIYQEGETNEWYLKTRGKNNLIVGVEIGGTDDWIMLGHVYWDQTFARTFCDILDREYDEPETADKLWETIYIEHISELPMVARRYPPGFIWEFDSLDDLSIFDPHFIENIDSQILDNICSTLQCTRTDVHHFIPIKQGLTNLSVRFEACGKPYVYRNPGAATLGTINRESETFSENAALKLGIDRTFIYEDPTEGWKLSHFIEDCTPFDYHDANHVSQAMQLIRKLHDSGIASSWTFDIFQKACEIVRQLDRIDFPGFSDLADLAAELDRLVKADGVAPVLCHNDFCDHNLLVHDGGIDLIDWEYSAMADYASDLGTFVCCSDYGISEAEDAIRTYFGHEPSSSEMRHCMAHIGLNSFYWLVWALYKDQTKEPIGEWIYRWYRSAKTFGQHALALYPKEGASE